MDWIKWVLPVLIALPLAGGILAGIISSDRARNALVTLLAVLIAAGGITVVNLSSGKFHLPSCIHADCSNKKTYDGDRQELIDLGYSPCKVCKP